ncbi:MAG: NupC/NupG family nucleoside CNT transporter [bacterium]
MIGSILFALMGLTILMGIAIAFSSNRSAIHWRTIWSGLILQLLFAYFVILTDKGTEIFDSLSKGFIALINFTKAGSSFVFGGLMESDKLGFVFAVQVLPTLIFFSALMSVLYHLNIMQKIVQAMSWAMTKAMRISGSESLSVAANVFIGQTEAPLVVRPYVSGMTKSELLTMMVGGMATIAGGVLAAFVGLLGHGDKAQEAYYAKHLLSASLMAAPATIVIAKLLMPETEQSQSKNVNKVVIEQNHENIIEAAASGAADGLKLAANVGAMLLAFIALLALVDAPIGWAGRYLGLEQALGAPLSLSLILGYVLSPLAWIIGTPWHDAVAVGGLIGEKIVTNEFVAYVHLGEIKDQLSDKAVLVSTYALCGFANFSSIAIQIGGIGGIAPERRSDLAKFGLKAVLGGTLATMMTATIASTLATL